MVRFNVYVQWYLHIYRNCRSRLGAGVESNLALEESRLSAKATLSGSLFQAGMVLVRKEYWNTSLCHLGCCRRC